MSQQEYCCECPFIQGKKRQSTDGRSCLQRYWLARLQNHRWFDIPSTLHLYITSILLPTIDSQVGDDSTLQSHVKSIINTQKPGTTELLMSSLQLSTLKVNDSNYSRITE
ncbi:hypothetical protein ACTFIU_000095 [Dictyostelium citrinum]